MTGPVAWVSPEQLTAHKDRLAGEGGDYLPARLTRDGLFTQPLYAAPQPPPADDDWRLQGYAYASKQATTCAGCGKHKHTPLRIDAMGGHVCLTCIDQKLGSMLGEFGYAPPPQAIDLERIVPPVWLSEQVGGPLDDLTSGQAWRDGFNECRTRTLLLIEQAQQLALIDGQAKCGGELSLTDALSDYLEAQDALDNWETAGPNRDLYESVMARRNSARRDLESAMQPTKGEGE